MSIVATGLVVGTYTVTGTTTDTAGDAGTWTYTLSVTPVTITQIAPTSGSVPQKSPYAGQLSTTGSDGRGVTFYEATSANSSLVLVSNTGAVSVANGGLNVGAYTVSGTTSDGSGDTGTWSFTLFVRNGTITVTPAYSSTLASSSASYTSQLQTVGSDGGTLTFSESASANSTNVIISSSGALRVIASGLTLGTYSVSGTVSDTSGDTGTWTYTLYVRNGTISVTPTKNSVLNTDTTFFTDQLLTSGTDGGAVNFTENNGANTSNVIVSSSGAITLNSAGLSVGSYQVSGTVSDGSGDVGTWSYTLYVVDGVTLTQIAPTTGTVPTSLSASFTDQLAVSGSDGGAITYVQTVSANSTNVIVSSTGGVRVKTGGLAAGSYQVSGTMSDTSGDAGTWTYTLIVTALSTTPTSASVSVASSSAFTQLLSTVDVNTVTYAQDPSGQSAGLSFNAATHTLRTTGTLAVGTYVATGTTSDTASNTGVWQFTLNVTPSTLTTTASVTTTNVASSAGFTTSLSTSGNYGGSVTYTQTGSASALSVSPTGVVTTTGTLSVGSYTTTGTTTDPAGDTGTFSYTLSVSASSLTTTTTADTTTTASSGTYSFNLLTTGNYGGSASYVKSSGSTSLLVSSSGQVTTTGTLAVGTYTINFTTSDPNGDTGSGSFTLSVNGIVTYNPESGTVSPATQTFAPSGLLTLPTPSRLGYTFNGWYNAQTAGNGSGSLIGNAGASYSPSSSLTLYAKWTLTNYTLSYSTPSGSSVSPTSATFTMGQSVTLPTPTWSMHLFQGWYDAASNGNLIGPAGGSYSPPAASTTIYAYWSVQGLLTTTSTSGTTYDTSSASFSATMTTTGTSLAVTYTQTGLTTYLRISSTGVVTTTGALAPGTYSTTASTSDANASAGSFTYTLSVYGAVSYNTQGGSYTGDTVVTFSSGGSVTLPTPLLADNTFNGWYTLSSGGSKIGNAGATYAPSASITLFAQWTPITYLVTYNAQGGTSIASATYTAGGDSLTLPSATLANNTFNGWYTQATGGTKQGVPGDPYAPSAASTLFAQWTPITYVVTYNSQGGTGAGASATYTAGGSALTLPTPTLANNNFRGWYDASSSGNLIGAGGATYSPSAVITLYAQWTPITYVVTYDANGGSVSPLSATYTAGGVALILPTPTQVNYTFNGWYSQANGGQLVGAAGVGYAPQSALTLHAQWTLIQYTVTFDANGGNVTSPALTWNSGASALTLPTPTLSNYTFAGWYDAIAEGTCVAGCATGATTLSYTPSGAITLHALWRGVLSFTYNDGTHPNTSVNFAPGAQVTLPTPSYPGYNFLGWFSPSGALIGMGGFSYTVPGSTTLSASWQQQGSLATSPSIGSSLDSATSFSLQLSTTGGSGTTTYSQTGSIKYLQVSSSGLVTSTKVLDIGSYTATGTTANGGLSGTFSFVLNVTGEVTFNYNNAGADANTVTTFNQGDVVSLPTPTRTNYNFDGWSTLQSGPAPNSVNLFGTMTPAASVTLYAQWSLITYHVTYAAQPLDKTTWTELTYSAGSGALTLPTPSRAGYIFNGWFDDPVSGNAIGAAGALFTPTSQSVLYGQWIAIGALTTTTTGETLHPSSSYPYTTQLITTGNNGTVIYTQTSNTTQFNVSSSGALTTKLTLGVGTYSVSGTTADSSGLDVGNFTFTLIVTAATLATTPSGTTITYSQWALFEATLITTGGAGNYTYVQDSTGQNAQLFFNPATGKITTAGTPSAATYTITGTVSDAYGDAGTWSYALVDPAGSLVTTSTGDTVDIAHSYPYSYQLATTGNYGAVTFVLTSPITGISLSSGGRITTSKYLAPGTYALTGTTSDSFGDTGTFSFSLVVMTGAITTSPSLGVTNDVNSATFTAHITPSGNTSTATFAQTVGSSVLVSSSGTVTTSGALIPGTYTSSGTISDAEGNTGTWSYTLTVTLATGIMSVTPVSGTTTDANSASFTAQLNVTGNTSAVTFTQTLGTNVLVSSSGGVATRSALGAGTYSASGTEVDGQGHTGTWSFTLTVTSTTPPPVVRVVITKPSTPQNVVATLASGIVTVTWTPSASVQYYTVSSVPDGNVCIVSGAATCTLANPLAKGQKRSYAVVATNSAGDSAPGYSNEVSVPFDVAPTTTTTIPSVPPVVAPTTTTTIPSVPPVVAPKITLTCFFAFNSSALSATAKAQITAYAKQIIDRNITTLTLAGYTDFIGGKAYNQALSTARAKSVGVYLLLQLRSMSHTGISVRMIGKGISRTSPERAQDRKVTVIS